MPGKPDNPTNFWQELKRRKVVRVIIVYAAASFVILELISIIEEPFGLPDWTIRFVFVILCVGLIISIVLSWIYDITPEGIEKTKPAHEITEKVPEKSSQLKAWKFATIISVVVIIGFVIFNIVSNNERSKDIQKLEKSIAVLPFANWTSDEESAHMGDAIANEINTQLSKINEFHVFSYTSSSHYKGSDKPSITQIGKELGANFIIEGSIERQDEDVSIHVQVIHAENDDHIWAHEFKDSWKNIFTIRAQIAVRIAEELKTVLSPEEIEQIKSSPTENPEAYDFWLKGMEAYHTYWSDYNLDYVNKSIDYFSKSIELDPEYSLAYAGLSRGYWMLGHYAPKPFPEYWEESKRLSNKAIELDPENSWAYAELGVVQHNWDWDSSAAKYSFKKALALSSNNEYCYVADRVLSYRLGNCSRLASLIEEHSRINPSVNPPSSNLMWLTCQQDFEEIRHIADEKWNYNTGIQPSFYYIIAYLNNGNYDRALKIAESVEDKLYDPSAQLSIKGHILAKKGDREGALKIIEDLNMLSNSRNVSNIFFANIYYALGEKESTLEYLEKALHERDWRIHAFWDPTAFNLINKDDPWLRDIIRRSWIPLSDTE